MKERRCCRLGGVVLWRGSGEGDTLMVVAMRCGNVLKVPVDAEESWG